MYQSLQSPKIENIFSPSPCYTILCIQVNRDKYRNNLIRSEDFSALKKMLHFCLVIVVPFATTDKKEVQSWMLCVKEKKKVSLFWELCLRGKCGHWSTTLKRVSHRYKAMWAVSAGTKVPWYRITPSFYPPPKRLNGVYYVTFK